MLAAGRVSIHNNCSGLELRCQAIGRKDWYFVAADEAGDVNAALVTVLASCQLHGLELWGYLPDLLCLLPAWPRQRALEVSPLRW